MDKYDVYAVSKDENGNIKDCYVHKGIGEWFSSEEKALKYVKNKCIKRNKFNVIFDMSQKGTSPSTMLYNATKGKFGKKAIIHIYGGKFLRTDRNDTTKDNLENIFVIP